MNICYNCHKTADFGHLVSHAKNRHAHTRKPNLHRAHMMIGGVRRAVLLCTSCIRMTKKSAAKAAGTKVAGAKTSAVKVAKAKTSGAKAK